MSDAEADLWRRELADPSFVPPNCGECGATMTRGNCVRCQGERVCPDCHECSNRSRSTAPPISDQLRAARLAAGLTQAALAERAHVRQATVNDVEAGRNTDLATLAKLAEALGAALVVHPGATPPERRAKR